MGGVTESVGRSAILTANAAKQCIQRGEDHIVSEVPGSVVVDGASNRVQALLDGRAGEVVISAGVQFAQQLVDSGVLDLLNVAGERHRRVSDVIALVRLCQLNVDGQP